MFFKLLMPIAAAFALAKLVRGIIQSVRGEACLTFSKGVLTAFRGQCPEKLRDELCAVARISAVTGRLKIRKRGGLLFSNGLSQGQQQQFRNVFYLYHE
jgi:hypothetical protein